MSKLEAVITRARVLAASGGEDEVIDERSGLTRADLELLIDAAERGIELAKATIGASGRRLGS